MGEVCGIWEPIVTTQEFKSGIIILKTHDTEKSREKRLFYLLHNLQSVEIDSLPSIR
jgi:hypothetical protein